MEPSFEEAFDFDLNFIQQPVQNVMSNNKLRKAILIAKKKTIATDSLIKKYLAKKEIVRQSEIMLNSTKEECKRVCIDYKDTLEKCTSLEKELQTLDQKYKTLESNYMLSQNQCEAIRSHANQLQSLIKENELKIESLQLENKLLDRKKEKEIKGKDTFVIKEKECKKENKRNHNKGYALIKKENGRLLKDILLFKDIIMGKTKLQKEHRLILNKYKKPKEEYGISSVFDDDNYSSDETDFFDDVTPPQSNDTSPYQNHNEKTAQVFKDNIDDQCASNVSNGIHECELDSEDTGRGSSLAFSDSGKFFNSPDYSYDTPHMEIIQSKTITKKFSDASTNTSLNIEHKSTSPLMFDDVPLLSDNMEMQGNKNSTPSICSPFVTGIPLSTEVEKIRGNKYMVDCASSPIPELDIINESFYADQSHCKITVEDLMLDVSLTLGTQAEATECKLKTVDCATSPIQGIDRVHVSLSPIKFNDIHKVSDKRGIENYSNMNPSLQVDMENHLHSSLLHNGSTVVENVNLPQISSVDLSTSAVVEICQNNTLEKNCLEENSSNSINSRDNDDKEIEMIFSSMRLEHRLLTPLPHTPLKLRKSLSNKQPPVIQENCTDHKCCKDIISLEKKYSMLQKNYAAMEKAIKSMKSSLQALTVLPLKSIDTGWMNGGSIDMYSDNDAHKEEEKLDQFTQNNLECINHLDSMKSFNKNNIDLRNSLSSDPIEEAMEVISDDNVPLSELILENVTKPKACRSVTYEDNELTKSPDKILNCGESVSPDQNRNRVRSFSPERNLSPVRDVSNTNSTQDKDLHKVKSNKHTKLSKLEKLRHKLLPKYKISGNIKSIKKKKSIVATTQKLETDKLLKNKLAFEKAVKIMAETKIKNNTVKNVKKIQQLKGEDSVEKNDNTSKLNLINIDKSIEENVTHGGIKSIRNPSPDFENIYMKNNRRTTRSQSENISETSNDKGSLQNVNKTKTVENNENENMKPISNSKVTLVYESKMVNQQTEHIELESTSVKSNRRTTRSQSKLSESEGDISSRYKHQQSIVKQDNTFTEGQIIDNEEVMKGKSNTRSQIRDINVALTSPEQADKSYQEKLNHNTNKTDDTLNSKQGSPESRKRPRPLCDDVFEPIPKRVLRSSKAKESIIENLNTSSVENNCIIGSNIHSDKIDKNICDTSIEIEIPQNKTQEVIDYGDLNIFTTTKNNCAEKSNVKSTFTYPKNSILCKSIEKYGKKSIRLRTNKVTEQMSNSVCTKLEEDIASIAQMPADKINQGMNKLVEDVKKMSIKTFLNGFMKYLRQPMRKQEMFKLVNTPPAPYMTKSEQILLFVIRQFKQDHTSIVESILQNMEFSLFQLNKTPEFDIVESMSHFYAIICRYFGLKHRLRLFLLDAMYCMSFKAVTVVKNCLDVWMHVLPLAHMGIAKSPLVTCLVYLLHFYKCEDKFKKIDVIRNTLKHKYFYKITELTEVKMLEMFMNAIKEINDVSIEKKILRTSLIILAKRRGAAWCQKNIIKNMLQPIIEKEKCSDVSKHFAVSMLGPLVKPYPMDMKVHSEIILNQLMDMLDQNPSDSMKEAIFTSLIYMSRQNHFRVTQALLNWEPESVSREFEGVIKDFVTEKPIKTWTKILPKMLFQQG